MTIQGEQIIGQAISKGGQGTVYGIEAATGEKSWVTAR